MRASPQIRSICLSSCYAQYRQVTIDHGTVPGCLAVFGI